MTPIFKVAILSLVVISCSETSNLDDINVSDIKEACDCSDAMEKIADVLEKATLSFSSMQEAKADTEANSIIELANQKTRAVAQKCQTLGINDSDIESCPSFPLLKEKSKRLNKRFR